MAAGHKTAAWPLALVYTGLIVYASLYPFDGWRSQGLDPLSFLFAPWPRYWTGFDVVSNLLGYAPLGFLLALGQLRGGVAGWRAFALAVATGALLSLALESLQIYLPRRVPSNVDFALNAAGAAAGALTAVLLERFGLLARWSRVRDAWLSLDARGALVLTALWPCALLFPAAVPFGLGQVLERVETAIAEGLVGTPFLEWLPLREVELQPLVPAAQLACVALGLLIPCLIGWSVIGARPKRSIFALLVFAAGIGASALSAALSWGPGATWAWLTPPVQAGVALAALLAACLLPLSGRGCAALALLALAVALSLLNQAPTSAYFAQTLQTWEQGRFIRFHGVAQWLGWLWPYAALIHLLVRLSRRERPLELPHD
ncbi:MAG: VanZ family protein [Burkholderiales bacterium]